MTSAGRDVPPRLSEIVDRYAPPLLGRLQATLQQGVESGQFRQIDIMQFIPSMMATIVFYFIAAPMLRRLRGFEPFSLEAIHSRRAAVLNSIAARVIRRSRIWIASRGGDCCPNGVRQHSLTHRHRTASCRCAEFEMKVRP